MDNEQLLSQLVDACAPAPGVRAIVLGGSRGRGMAGPHSDHDIGLYIDSAALDVDSLRDRLSPLVDGGRADLTGVGEWGPRVVGGGWLRVGGEKVDILYRDLRQVADSVEAARSGVFDIAYQVGHPHGFSTAIWPGEIATCRILHDPQSEVTDLKQRTTPYPEKLRASIVARMGWETGFAIENAGLAAAREEMTHLAGCAYRALSCAAQVVFALNGRWLINEKGAVPEAASLDQTLPDLRDIDADIWRAIGVGSPQGAVDALLRLKEGLDTLIG